MSKHLIKIESTPHGVLGVRHAGLDQQYCEAGELVILKWQPDAKWGLQEAHYTDGDGNVTAIDLTPVKIDGKDVVVFTMPNAEITVGGTFKRFVAQDWTQGHIEADGTDGQNAVNPFKGWWPDPATLMAAITAIPGDYAYVKGATSSDPVAIYEYSSTDSTNNYWADSGRTFNPENNQEFASGEPLNTVHIVNDFTTGGDKDVATAEVAKQLGNKTSQIGNDIFQFNFTFNGAPATELAIRVVDSTSSIFVTPDNERHFAIPCVGGDVIEVERNDDMATVLRFLKQLIPASVSQPLVYSDASGYTSSKSISVAGYHYKFTVPNDVTYVLVQVRTASAASNNLLPKLLMLNGIDILKTYTERANEKVQYEADLSSNVTSKGYYNSNGSIINNDGWKRYKLEISVGDIIKTNYSHNLSYTFARNVLFGEDGKTVVKLMNCTDNYTITQADWNDGARFYGISWRLAEPSVDNNPYLFLIRNYGMSAMFSAQALTEANRIKKNLVVLKLENLFNFDVNVYDNTGRKTTHNFIRYYKKWDSLEYTDAGGNTQTATDVVSSDVWNNDVIKYGTNTLCQGNTNFITSPLPDWGTGSHLGDGHGCEVMNYLTLMVDGKEIEPAVSTAEYECKEFKMILSSDIYASGGGGNTNVTQYPKLDTNGHPIILFKHHMEVTITADNDVLVDNKLEVCQDGVSFLSCDSAMMECNYGDFDRVIISGRDKTYISSISDSGVTTALAGTDEIPTEGTNGVFASKVEMYGNGFYVTQEIEPDMEDATPNVFPYFYNDRLKCYLYPVLCQRSPSGTTPQVFNTGDVIVTHNTRHIRLSDEIEE